MDWSKPFKGRIKYGVVAFYFIIIVIQSLMHDKFQVFIKAAKGPATSMQSLCIISNIIFFFQA